MTGDFKPTPSTRTNCINSRHVLGHGCLDGERMVEGRCVTGLQQTFGDALLEDALGFIPELRHAAHVQQDCHVAQQGSNTQHRSDKCWQALASETHSVDSQKSAAS
eukprot:scaffold156798_cov34-Prasinocladus_malaysianus.AAC.3